MLVLITTSVIFIYFLFEGQMSHAVQTKLKNRVIILKHQKMSRDTAKKIKLIHFLNAIRNVF